MENQEDEPMLTATQVCGKLQISRETLRRWHKSGKIKRYEVAGTHRYKLSEILNKTSN